MIVTCERCSTQFSLDDKRVPPEGVRVRCSRCKHAFRVELPATTQEERVEQATARALEPDTPDITQDMPDEEEDWQFNDERASTDDTGEDPAGESVESEEVDVVSAGSDADAYGFGLQADGVDSMDSGPGEPAPEADEAILPDSGLDLDGGAAPSPARDFEAESPFDLQGEADGSGASGLDLGAPGGLTPDGVAPDDLTADGLAPDDLNLGGVDATPAGLDLSADAGDGGGLDLAGAGSSVSAAELESPEDPTGAAQIHGQGAAGDEIGSPDQWDFFADDPPKASSSRVARPAPTARPRATATRSIPQGLDAEDDASHSAQSGRIGSAVGWLVVVAIFVGGLYAGFAPRGGEMPVAATVQHVGDWRVGEISARWIDNLVAGDLYVVSAVLESGDAAAGGRGDGLYLLLLDAHGEIVKRPPVPVGPPLPDGLLRQVDPRDLQRVAGQARVLGPGASRRVEAVIASLPARATAFRFVTGAQLAELLAPGEHASPGSGSEILPTQQGASAAEFGEPGEVL